MRRLDNATHLTSTSPLSDEQLHALYAYPAGGQPCLRVNFVSTLDGAAAADGKSGPLGGPGDRRVFETLRDLADVVLVGAGTVRSEGYGGAKISGAQQFQRLARGQGAVPPIAVVTASGKLDPALRVFTEAAEPTIVFVSAAAAQADLDAMTAAGAVVIVCGAERVDLMAALDALAGRGLRKVLCEGGPRLFGELIEHDMVDELCLTISPLLAAGDAPRIASSSTAGLRAMTPAHLLLDDAGVLLGRWVRARSTR